MTNKSYIIVPLLVSAAMLFFLLVWPKYQDLQILQTNVSQKETELDETKKYFEEIERIYQQLESLKQSLSVIEGALPDKYSIPSIFHYLQNKAGSNGLVLKEISLEDVTVSSEKPTLKEINISTALGGKYQPSFTRFLETIEKSARLFEIENITFSAPLPKIKESPEEPQPIEESFDFHIELKTHGY